MLTTDLISQQGRRSGVREPLTVLFVDNNHEVRQWAKTCLSSAGYEVLLAADGFEGLGAVVQSCPDAVFVDTMMTRLDGYQMCALIKSNSDYQHIPVIMLSSKDGRFDRERALLVGCDAHVSKPCRAEDLAAALKPGHHNQTRPQ